MTWYARLARWQRLGIVLSISWAIFAGLHQHYEDAEQATKDRRLIVARTSKSVNCGAIKHTRYFLSVMK